MDKCIDEQKIKELINITIILASELTKEEYYEILMIYDNAILRKFNKV